VDIKEEQSANAKLGADKAKELAAGASKIIVSKGKKVTVFDMKKDPPDEATLLAHMLGTTGNLRAPTIKRGKTLLVGFNQDEYEGVLG
jgi:arsenate reductase-like glutaredoxin family protein